MVSTREIEVERVWRAIQTADRAVVVDSPPGAGKSTLVREMSRRAMGHGPVPVIAQTNSQADDLVRGYLTDSTNGGPKVVVGRMHAADWEPPRDLVGHAAVLMSGRIDDLRDADIIVSTNAKWSSVAHTGPFAIIDEAYQMRSDGLLPIGSKFDSLLLVGDPGQLSPFTEADPARVRGVPFSPVENAASSILRAQPDAPQLSLAQSYRLDHRAAPLVSTAFYHAPFTSAVAPGARSLAFRAIPMSGQGRAAIAGAAEDGWAFVELPAALAGDVDPEIVNSIIGIVSDLVVSGCQVTDERGSRALRLANIAIGVSHRSQRAAIRNAIAMLSHQLHVDLSDITVDTANRLQGREFDILIAWHPLSGRDDATEFHVEAGRLCVLLSRHRQACIVVGRSGMEEALDSQVALPPMWLNDPRDAVDSWQAQANALELLGKYRVAA